MFQSKVSWKDGMAFEAELEGLRFGIDADPELGGRGLGPKPKGLLLTSLVGCTGMDVIAILAKMRLRPTRFEVSAEGMLADDHPRSFTRIVIRYQLEGELPPNKVDRAVRLSEAAVAAPAAPRK